MDKIPPKDVLANIKADLDILVGEKIKVKANRGRKRIVEKVGILENTYPSVFVIKVKEKDQDRRVSYSYADVLTKTVQLTLCQDDGNEICQAN